MEIRNLYVPDGLVAAIQRRLWAYTKPKSILNTISVDIDLTVAIIGDPANGSYEWVIWDAAKHGIVDHSNDGWGCPASALRCVLNKLEI